MYVNTNTNNTPERRRKKKNASRLHHHNMSPVITAASHQEVIDESRYPTSPEHRYEEMDFRLHRSIDGPYNQQQREGYDDNYQYNMIRDQPLPSVSTESEPSIEASIQNPTQLFNLMNRHLWAQAMKHIELNLSDAAVWINSSGQMNLPLHLACIMLSLSARGAPPPPPLHFMEALINAYPGAAAEKNNEGMLPIHLASECIDLTSRYLESEGILLLLSKAFPAGLSEKNREGKLPLQILEERGISAFASKFGKSGIIRYMKSQTKLRKKPKQIDIPSDDNMNGFVTPKKKNNSTPKSDKGYYQAMTTPGSDRQAKSSHNNRQSPASSQYRGYDVLSTPTNSQGYDLMNTPNLYSSPSPRIGIPYSNHNEPKQSTNTEQKHNMHTSSSLRPSEYVLLSPPKDVSSRSLVVAPMSTPTSNNDALERKLQQMEIQYAQLQNDFDSLRAVHSETVSDLKEQTKRAEECQYKVNVLSESEDDRIRLNSELKVKYTKLKDDFDELNAVHAANVSELSQQTKRADEQESMIKVLKEREDSRIGLSNELKESKVDLESKVSQQTKINSKLKEELNEKTKQLNDMRVRESSLLQQLLKKLDNNEDRRKEEDAAAISQERDDLHAKNILLREVAIDALATIGKLSAIKSDASACLPSQSGLTQRLEAIELSSEVESVSSEQRNSRLKPNEVLKMLQPIIADNQNMQQDVISRTQQMLQLCNAIARLVDGISSKSGTAFDFEKTLQALGQVMSTNIGLVQSMDVNLIDVENILMSLATATKQSPVVTDLVLANNDGGHVNTAALYEVVEITKKTSRKLESLASTISKLNFGEVNLKNEEDVRKCVKAADEITQVFQLSLQHLTKDAEKIRGIADAAINENNK